MIIETFLYNRNVENRKCNYNKMRFMLMILSKLISMSIALYLAWDCNKDAKTFFKILVLIFALLFSDVYILFYLIYRILLKNKC